jgi:hypothetical protein
MHRELAHPVVRLCGATHVPASIAAFAGGEIRIRREGRKGKNDVQAHPDPD